MENSALPNYKKPVFSEPILDSKPPHVDVDTLFLKMIIIYKNKDW
ncbi:hypothetical protein [Antarcticibacterium sp. W02-3]|nr:hypothetical protein [Antarcticibacterium sp. W02-3]